MRHQDLTPILKKVEKVYAGHTRAEIAAAAECTLLQVIIDSTHSREEAESVLGSMFERLHRIIHAEFAEIHGKTEETVVQ